MFNSNPFCLVDVSDLLLCDLALSLLQMEKPCTHKASAAFLPSTSVVFPSVPSAG